MAAKVHNGVFIADRDSATVADAAKAYLEQREQYRVDGRITLKCLKHNRWAVLHHLVPTFGRLKLTQIEPELVEKWARQMRIDAKVNSNSINEIVNVLKQILDLAKRSGWLSHHPLRAIKLDLPERRPPVVDVPQDQSVAEILNALTYRAPGQSEITSCLRMMVFLVAFAGLRPNEAAALQWENVDLECLEIRVRHGLSKGEGFKEELKTRAGRRDVDMLPILHAELDEHRQRMCELDARQSRVARAPIERAVAQAEARTGRVLHNRYGDWFMPESMGEDWRHLRRRPGMPRTITLYSLRHYAGSLWLRGGMELFRVSRMLGHTDLKFTERTYIKLLREIDETRLPELQRISDRQVERFRRHGLEVRATSIRATAPPQPAAVVNGTGHAPSIVTVAPVVRDAALPIQAAPAAPILTQGALREAQRTRIYELHDQGIQPEDIARLIGTTDDTVRHWLEMRDVPVVVGRRDVRKAEWSELRARARSLAATGQKTALEIAHAVGVFITTVRHWARTESWQLPRPQGPERTFYRAIRPALATKSGTNSGQKPASR